MIGDEQQRFFRDQGYLVVQDVFSATELADMRAALARLIEDARTVTEHGEIYDLEPAHTADNPRVRRIKQPQKVDEAFARALKNPNLLGILQRMVGPNIVLRGGKLNIKAARGGSPVEWHQDWAFYPSTNDDLLAVGIYLEDGTPDNGPLLVVPGSHRGPTLDHHAHGYFVGAVSPETLGTLPDQAVALTGPAGACTFHHVRTLHGSAQNTSAQDRPLLLFEVLAADAFGLTQMTSWADRQAALLCGELTIVPRFAPCPIRMPYPPTPREG